MRQNIYDMIAASNKFGHPDLFITMTCNLNWEEIQTALLDGHKAEDRPDISCLLFPVKRRVVMKYIISDNPFSVTIARIRVVEFQKRGFPHADIIILLNQTAKEVSKNPQMWTKLFQQKYCQSLNHIYAPWCLDKLFTASVGQQAKTLYEWWINCAQSSSKRVHTNYRDPEECCYPLYRRIHPKVGRIIHGKLGEEKNHLTR